MDIPNDGYVNVELTWVFQYKQEGEIVWNPIAVVCVAKRRKKALIQAVADRKQKFTNKIHYQYHNEAMARMIQTPTPKNMGCSKALNPPKAEYTPWMLLVL